MSNWKRLVVFKKRLITAVILIPVIVIFTIKAPTDLFAIGIGIFTLVAAWEWGKLVGYAKPLYLNMFVAITGILMLIIYNLIEMQFITWIIYLGILWWLFSICLVFAYQSRQKKITGNIWTGSMAGLIILIPAWLSLTLLHISYTDKNIIIALFILIWSADSAAFFAGRKFGKHLLAVNVSPGKTWEGVAGALIVTTIVTLIYALLTGQINILYILMIVSLLTVTFSIIGDLVESIFKRSAGMKNSGNIFPGHGGMLDRIDSITAAAPVFLTGQLLLDQIK